MVQFSSAMELFHIVLKENYHQSKPKNPKVLNPDPLDRYLSELSMEEIIHLNLKQKLYDRKIIAIDPGKSDLLFAVNNDDKAVTKKWRFTQNQNKFERKFKEDRLKMQKEKKRFRIVTEIWMGEGMINRQRKTIKTLEREMSYENPSSTCIPEDFLNYVTAKLYYGKYLKKFYAQPVYRDRQFTKNSLHQKSKHRMRKSFVQKFGKGCVVTIGDWSENHHRRFHEPNKGNFDNIL